MSDIEPMAIRQGEGEGGECRLGGASRRLFPFPLLSHRLFPPLCLKP